MNAILEKCLVSSNELRVNAAIAISRATQCEIRQYQFAHPAESCKLHIRQMTLRQTADKCTVYGRL